MDQSNKLYNHVVYMKVPKCRQITDKPTRSIYWVHCKKYNVFLVNVRIQLH